MGIRIFFILIWVCGFVSSSHAAIVSFGDTYQQPNGTYHDESGLILESGGTILQRLDGKTTEFSTRSHIISGGSVQADLELDRSNELLISGGLFNKSVLISRMSNGMAKISGGVFNDTFTIRYFRSGPPLIITGGIFNDSFEIDVMSNNSSAIISGGVFNDPFIIDRMIPGTSLTISSGVFNSSVIIQRNLGDLIITGGMFSETITGAYIDKAPPTADLTFMGSNWQLDGEQLLFPHNEVNLLGLSGLLVGTLNDGNSISVQIDGFSDSNLYVISNAPIPGSVWLFLSALVLMAKRLKNSIKSFSGIYNKFIQSDQDEC